MMVAAVSARSVLVYATSDTPAASAASMARRWLATRSVHRDRGRDQQQLVRPREGRREAVLVGEVGPAHHDAAVGQVLDPGDVPAGRDDLRGRHSAPQQRLDGKPAQLAGRSGDDD